MFSIFDETSIKGVGDLKRMRVKNHTHDDKEHRNLRNNWYGTWWEPLLASLIRDRDKILALKMKR